MRPTNGPSSPRTEVWAGSSSGPRADPARVPDGCCRRGVPMLRAMRTAAAGMRAQQLYLDTVAHNLANVNTTGFKRARLEFEDLLYQTIQPVGSGGEGGPPEPLQIGHGS